MLKSPTMDMLAISIGGPAIIKRPRREHNRGENSFSCKYVAMDFHDPTLAVTDCSKSVKCVELTEPKDIRSGSKADIVNSRFDVRFTFESGHSLVVLGAYESPTLRPTC